MVIFGHFIFPILPVATPMVLNSILDSKNITYEKSLAFQIEYFFDVDQHFTFPFMHTFCISAYSGIIIGACGTMYIIFIYYLIGKFNAVKYVNEKYKHII